MLCFLSCRGPSLSQNQGFSQEHTGFLSGTNQLCLWDKPRVFQGHPIQHVYVYVQPSFLTDPVLSASLCGDRYTLGLYGERGPLVIFGFLLLNPSWNFFMVYNFVSTVTVNNVSWASDIRYCRAGLSRDQWRQQPKVADFCPLSWSTWLPRSFDNNFIR